MSLTPDQREIHKLRGHLRDLSKVVTAAIARLDAEMKLPSSHERGQRIARITNALEMAKDRAEHFGLGKPLQNEPQVNPSQRQ